MQEKNNTPKSTSRVFFAIDLTQDTRQKIIALLQKLYTLPGARNIKWVKPEKLHITLRFMGEIDNEKIQPLIHHVAKAIKEIDPFTIHFNSVFIFPSHHPHVVAIEYALTPQIMNLYQTVERAIVSCGFPAQERLFLPHLTLGRLNKKHWALPDEKIQFMQKMRVNHISLWRSQLSHKGSVYSIIQHFDFT